MTTGHETKALDLRERGNDKNGQPIALDRRLFMQLLGFDCAAEQPLEAGLKVLSEALLESAVPSVIYEDVNHPRGFAVLTCTENPEDFVLKVRPRLEAVTRQGFVARPALSMLGRTYATGFEQDLEYWLLRRPRETVLNPAWPWAIWYPLRRKGGFERLDGKERGGIMREHGGIGRAYGEADLAHDVRLACHGLDQSDNDFVIGLMGAALHPLSHVVQAMRATRQTAEFMEQMGPFFVGHAVFRSSGAA